jgi:hypothetical protein
VNIVQGHAAEQSAALPRGCRAESFPALQKNRPGGAAQAFENSQQTVSKVLALFHRNDSVAARRKKYRMSNKE